MATNSLIKRIEKLEQKTGQNMPETKLFYVKPDNYLEKELEIEQAEKDGYQVIAVHFIGPNDETEHPEYFKYCNRRREKRRDSK